MRSTSENDRNLVLPLLLRAGADGDPLVSSVRGYRRDYSGHGDIATSGRSFSGQAFSRARGVGKEDDRRADQVKVVGTTVRAADETR